MKLTKILAATDFSKYSGFALEWAGYLTQVMKARLLLAHVIPDEEGKIFEEVIGEGAVAQIPLGLREKVIAERKGKFKEQVEACLSREIQKAIEIEEVIRIGVPFLEIIKLAKEQEVDLIVLGTHGRTGLAHVLIGSVAEKVVHHAHCPVLTIKHPQYKFIAP